MFAHSAQNGTSSSPRQPYRVLTDKPSQLRVVVAEEVVVQPHLFVAILVL